MYSYIRKSALNDHLGSSTDPCYIQNHVMMNRVIKIMRRSNFINVSVNSSYFISI